MEDLKSKYGFSDEQMDDIRELVVSSIKEVIPAVLEESTKILAEKCKESVTNATKNYFPKVNTPPSREAVQFITRNKQSWKVQLAERNKLYGQFIRCESLLDIYGQCLQEEPVYVPRRYRRDKIHILYDEEKSIRTTADLQNMQTDMEVLKIRRDNFKRVLEKCDANSQKFVTEKISDDHIALEVASIWDDSIHQDQEKVEQIWAKKISTMHTAFEKDKLNLSRQQDEKQAPKMDDHDMSEIDSDTDDEDEEEEYEIPQESVIKTVHFGEDLPPRLSKKDNRKNRHPASSLKTRKPGKRDTIQRTIQNDAFIPSTSNQAPMTEIVSKNDQRDRNQGDRKIKGKRQYPLRSSTYLDSISRCNSYSS